MRTMIARFLAWAERRTRRWRLPHASAYVLAREDDYATKHDAWRAGFRSGRWREVANAHHEVDRRVRLGLPLSGGDVAEELSKSVRRFR